jgi:hypothetical protein
MKSSRRVMRGSIFLPFEFPIRRSVFERTICPPKPDDVLLEVQISRAWEAAVGKIVRRRRSTCRLSCEIVESGRRRVQGRVVTISEGGLALVTELAFEQGDPVRLLIKSSEDAKPIAVSAIVWNNRSAASAGGATRMRRYGCVVSDPSRSFLSLLDCLAPQPARVESVPIAKPRPRDASTEWAEPDLPRSREILPPPKSEPEESWPYFRVRMKQIGEPRTRILTLRARSASQAEILAHENLTEVCPDAEGWAVLHIARVSDNR